MSDRHRTRCPTCGGVFEPDDEDVVEAIEIVPMRGFGAPSDTAEGMHALFHPWCFSEGDSRFRRVAP